MIKARRCLLLVLLVGNCVYSQRLLADAPPGTTESAPAVPTIIPNGIIALFGEPQVMFKVSTAAAPGQSAAPEPSFLLSAGEQRAGIKVKMIDAKAGVITFDNHGVIQKLTLVTGTAWSSASGSGADLAAANNPQTPNPHRLVRRMNLADDPRRQQLAADADQSGPVAGASGFAPLPPGGPVEANSQPVDNSQKLPAPDPAYSSTPAPAQSDGSPSSGSGTSDPAGSYDNLTPAEVLAQEIAAGGDVPPPPPATGR